MTTLLLALMAIVALAVAVMLFTALHAGGRRKGSAPERPLLFPADEASPARAAPAARRGAAGAALTRLGGQARLATQAAGPRARRSLETLRRIGAAVRRRAVAGGLAAGAVMAGLTRRTTASVAHRLEQSQSTRTPSSGFPAPGKERPSDNRPPVHGRLDSGPRERVRSRRQPVPRHRA